MYEKHEYITTKYCSPFGEMNLTSLMLLCQEIAIEDAERRGYDRKMTIDRGYLWVVGKQHFEIERMPKYEETVRLVSYPGKRLANFFLRHYRIYSEANELLVKGVSVWCVIDKNARKSVTPEEAKMPMPVESMEGEFDFPKSYPPFLGDHHVVLEATYSRCDVNAHMNNTKYLDFALDHISLDYLKHHEPKILDITYKKEIPLGNKVEVSYGHEEDTYYFSSSNFDIRIIYREK